MKKYLKKIILGVITLIFGGGLVLASVGAPDIQTLQVSNLPKKEIVGNQITPYNPIPYEVKLAQRANDNKSIQFVEGNNFISFTPYSIGWDTEDVLDKKEAVPVKRKNTSKGNEINFKEVRDIESVKYSNVFGTGIDVGVLAYEDVFRKITKINSLASLGAIPVDAKYLEIEFEIESTYPLPLGILEDDILLRDGIFLKTSLAWDINEEIDIESEIIFRDGKFFLIKRILVDWLKNAQFPVYTDADTTVNNNVDPSTDPKRALWGPYWTDEDSAMVFFADDGEDLSFATTTDGGATWATTEISVGNVAHLSVWYDKETPGDTGTTLHIAWADPTDNVAYYRSIDATDGTLGTERTVDSANFGSDTNSKVSITKTVSGNLIYAYNAAPNAIATFRSSTSTESWVARADVFESAFAVDFLLLYPANTSDDDDAIGLYWDVSANEISIKMYDESGNSWTETSVSGSMFDQPSQSTWDASVRHSDSHILLAAHSDEDTAGDDLMTWDLTVDSIASPTVTAKTNIFTDKNESTAAGMVINQQTDDVYVGYLTGSAFLSTISAFYQKSSDGMDNWDGETAYSEAAEDDLRMVAGGRRVGDDGGKIQFTFYNDDLFDIYVNLVNDVDITAVAPPAAEVGVTPPDFIIFE